MRNTTLQKIKITQPVTGIAFRGIAGAFAIGDGVDVIIFARNKADVVKAAKLMLARTREFDVREFKPVLIVPDKQP